MSKFQELVPIYQWGVTNAEVNAFEYRDKSGYHQSSKSFAQRVLLTFIQDCGPEPAQGCWIPDDFYVTANPSLSEPLTPGAQPFSTITQCAPSEAHQAFRDALTVQLQQLTGIKPRIVYEKNDVNDQMQWKVYAQ